MSIYNLGMGSITLFCKYGTNHREQKCHFCELEIRIKAIEERQNAIIGSNIRPHKCPICDGNGEIITNHNELLTSHATKFPKKICHCCDGKGVLWR